MSDSLDKLGAAVKADDRLAISTAVGEYAEFCYRELCETHDDAGIEFITSLFRVGRLQDMSNAHAVLELLIYDWGLYSESAKVTLLEELVANYDRLADWMGSFVITELLGEHFRDAEAMGAIESLVARVKMSEPRALLANAVERFIRHRPNVSLLSSPLNYAA